MISRNVPRTVETSALMKQMYNIDIQTKEGKRVSWSKMATMEVIETAETMRIAS